ncbi:MAG: ArnT family glycosyltransferase [Thermodesulfovibrionales bacterium]
MRSHDDNRLTSWESAFRAADPLLVLSLLIPGIMAAWLFPRLPGPGRHPAVFLFGTAYAASVLFWSEPELILDASRYFAQAKYLELYGAGYFFREWGRGIFAWTDMPVMPFLYGVLFRLFGESRLIIQLLTTFCFSMTPVLTFLVGERLWDKETGFTGGMLLLGIPYLFPQVPLMLVDIPLMFFFLLSVYTFIVAVERGGVMTGVAAVPLCLTFYIKYSAVLMLTELLVITGVYVLQASFRREKTAALPAKEVLLRGGAVFLISGLLIGIIFMAKTDVFLAQIKLLLDYQKPGLARWGESYSSTFLFQVHPVLSLAALFSLWTAIKKRDHKYIIVLWLVLLVFVLQIRRTRYIIAVFPMLSLMAAYGLMQVTRVDLRRFMTAAVVVSSVVTAFCAYRPFLNTVSVVNLKDAGQFVNTLRGDTLEVITAYANNPEAGPAVAVPILDLFTDRQVYYRDLTEAATIPEDAAVSSMRFTWEYRNPPYYEVPRRTGLKDTVVVVITDIRGDLPGTVREATRGYASVRTFEADEHEFAFKTYVRVYSD